MENKLPDTIYVFQEGADENTDLDSYLVAEKSAQETLREEDKEPKLVGEYRLVKKFTVKAACEINEVTD